jgi:PhoH-like ATPase
LLSLAAGLEQVIEKKIYKSLLICRPIVPVGNDIGFLPGDKKEKLDPWMAPIKDNLKQLLFSGRKSRYNEMTFDQFLEEGVIEMEAITYLRGRSISDAFILIDEAQNLSAHELKTIITRAGENTKIILTGDVGQIDSMFLDAVSNGLTIAIEKFKPYAIAGHITLVKGERSELSAIAVEAL